jgi:hypothetical protein
MNGILEVEWDMSEVEKLRNAGFEKAVTRTAKKAGRDSIRALKSAAVRSIRFRKRIRLRKINDSLPTSTRGGNDLESLEWRMDVSGDPIPLVDFPHRQTAQGVTVAVNANSRKLIKSAFVATLKSGHEGVFRRRGKARLPIDELFSTKVLDLFNDDGMIPAISERARVAWETTWFRVLPLELAK